MSPIRKERFVVDPKDLRITHPEEDEKTSDEKELDEDQKEE